MKVINHLPTAPDENDRVAQPLEIKVESHASDPGRVHLRIGAPCSTCTITLRAAELLRAVANATNHAPVP